MHQRILNQCSPLLNTFIFLNNSDDTVCSRPAVLCENRGALIQAACRRVSQQLQQTGVICHLHIQPQEGAVHLRSAAQARLCLLDRQQEVFQKSQVAVPGASVRLPQPLEVSGLGFVVQLGVKVLAKTSRSQFRVEAEELSGVQLTFAVQQGNTWSLR